nr:hypothetical protein [Mucilaginibacter sp. L294]
MNTKSVRSIIITWAVVLTLLEVIIWWVFNYDVFNVPIYVPFTPVKTYGFLFTVVLITIFIVFQKKLLALQPAITILKLVVLSTLIGCICEIFIQALRSNLDKDGVWLFAKGVILVSLADAFIAFFIAYQLKTRKTGMLLLFIFILGAVVNVLTYFFKR